MVRIRRTLKQPPRYYSGPRSVQFWNIVNALNDDDHMLYIAACALQDHEGRMWQLIDAAKQRKARETRHD